MVSANRRQAEGRQAGAWDVRSLSQKTLVKPMLDHVAGCVLGTKLGARTES